MEVGVERVKILANFCIIDLDSTEGRAREDWVKVQVNSCIGKLNGKMEIEGEGVIGTVNSCIGKMDGKMEVEGVGVKVLSTPA